MFLYRKESYWHYTSEYKKYESFIYLRDDNEDIKGKLECSIYYNSRLVKRFTLDKDEKNIKKLKKLSCKFIKNRLWKIK